MLRQILITLFVCAVLKSATAITITTWTGGSSNFNDPSNWDNGLPNNTVNATISSSDFVNVTQSISVYLLTISSGCELHINPGVTFTGPIELNSGSIYIYGTTLSPITLYGSSSYLYLSGTASSINNDGGYLYIYNGSTVQHTVNLLSSGDLKINGTVTIDTLIATSGGSLILYSAHLTVRSLYLSSMSNGGLDMRSTVSAVNSWVPATTVTLTGINFWSWGNLTINSGSSNYLSLSDSQLWNMGIFTITSGYIYCTGPASITNNGTININDASTRWYGYSGLDMYFMNYGTVNIVSTVTEFFRNWSGWNWGTFNGPVYLTYSTNRTWHFQSGGSVNGPISISSNDKDTSTYISGKGYPNVHISDGSQLVFSSQTVIDMLEVGSGGMVTLDDTVSVNSLDVSGLVYITGSKSIHSVSLRDHLTIANNVNVSVSNFTTSSTSYLTGEGSRSMFFVQNAMQVLSPITLNNIYFTVLRSAVVTFDSSVYVNMSTFWNDGAITASYTVYLGNSNFLNTGLYATTTSSTTIQSMDDNQNNAFYNGGVISLGSNMDIYKYYTPAPAFIQCSSGLLNLIIVKAYSGPYLQIDGEYKLGGTINLWYSSAVDATSDLTSGRTIVYVYPVPTSSVNGTYMLTSSYGLPLGCWDSYLFAYNSGYTGSVSSCVPLSAVSQDNICKVLNLVVPKFPFNTGVTPASPTTGSTPTTTGSTPTTTTTGSTPTTTTGSTPTTTTTGSTPTTTGSTPTTTTGSTPTTTGSTPTTDSPTSTPTTDSPTSNNTTTDFVPVPSDMTPSPKPAPHKAPSTSTSPTAPHGATSRVVLSSVIVVLVSILCVLW